MHIEIESPRPLALLLLASTVAGVVYWQTTGNAASSDTASVASVASSSEESVASAAPMPAVPVPQAQQQFAQAPMYYPMMPMVYPTMMPAYGTPNAAYGTMPQYVQNAQLPLSMMSSSSLSSPTPSVSISDTQTETDRLQVESDMRYQRARIQLLADREKILRGQLQALEDSRTALNRPMTAEELQLFNANVQELTRLLQDKTDSEQELTAGLKEMFASQRETELQSAALPVQTNGEMKLSFPIAGAIHINALFHDTHYPYPFPHLGIDIRAPQGTPILAPDDMIIVSATNNGLGYSYVAGEDATGILVKVGHVSKILVQVGESVKRGDIIAYSGGTPGTEGAGKFTTGPHVHFEVWLNGEAVDPLKFLPPVATGDDQ